MVMVKRGITLCLCAALFMMGGVALGADADVSEEIEKLKEANADLLERVDALEGNAETDGSASPGRFDLGSGTTLKVKGDVRVRNEEMRNTFDFDNSDEDNWNSTRLRTRLGFDVDYKNKAGAYIQLMNEYRWGQKTEYNYSRISGQGNAQDISVDNAYIRLNLEEFSTNLPFVATAGRQDLLANPEKGWRGMYGEGWLFFDGTPHDGSGSISFDSAKLRFNGIEKTTIDFIFAKPADIDRAGGLQKFAHSRDDEEAYVLYGITRLTDPVKTEVYAMHRNKNRTDPIGGSTNFEDPRLQTSVFGGRLSTSGLMDGHVAWAAEGAYQTGSLHPESAIGRDTNYGGERVRRQAYAGYSWVQVNANKEMPDLKPSLKLRFDYMSGDNPHSRNVYEGWDSFYAEWPSYSELLIYNLWDGFGAGTQNPNLGSFTNMFFPSVSGTMKPEAVKGLSLTATYRYMLAARKNADDAGVGGDDRKLGDLYMFLTRYQIAKGLSSHFLFEYFNPGSYYDPNDDAWFARVQFCYRF